MPITEQKNLQGCIQEFCKEELYRRNLISCRSCSGECTMGKDKTVTTKRMLFATLPEILVFQMGRFEERKMSTSTKIQKKTTNITFAREIEMDEESSQSPKRYCLYGVVNHGGSIHGGHYTACVKVCGNTTETWYNCSDANVRVTSDPSCQSSEAAYLLFYHRVPRS
ncbi:ubiquitin carboxyl-terminal hydrolase 2-like [Mizuhopecten yessoensis]|uniref:ubiquitin carboxyl-terminal hydrolase 2-like n=1 Tax=Mizuhopecten yessoensis TaxID=6573 RepID=UPI000B4591A1|nr:ubiquitin carboxyl-terminal hydrolase 2-like [Mizuhopecten yessoensis]